MKIKNIYIASIIGLATLNSCDKNFLDRMPETEISDADYWKSPDDLKLYANNFYSNLLPDYASWGTTGIYGLDADNGSDNMIGTRHSAALNGERIVPGSEGGYGAYTDWSGLKNVNYLLANYTKVEAPFESVQTYVGEALFFRSYFYFDKLKSFGDLPWVSKPLEMNSPEVYNERLPRNQVVDSIMADLDKAVQYLPTKSAATDSRVSKEVAMLLQARIALYEGTWERYHKGTEFGVEGSDGEKYLKKAADVSGKLIEQSGGFALTSFGTDEYGYWKLFNQTSYRTNDEVMLWREYNVALGLSHRWHRYTRAGGGRGVTKDLVDAYLYADGKPAATTSHKVSDATLKDVVTNRDPRLKQLLYINDGEHITTNNRPNSQATVFFEYPSFDQGIEYTAPTGYQLYKGHNPDYNQQQDYGTTGLILFRYAEALLIFAEARAELGEITQGDLDKTINELRKRVGMPALTVSPAADPNAEFKGLSPILNEIRRERRVELAAEGYRHDDLHRWAAMKEKIVGWKPKGAKKSQWETNEFSPEIVALAKAMPADQDGYIEFFKNTAVMKDGYGFKLDRDYLAPIPVDQLTLNPKIKQNPGW